MRKLLVLLCLLFAATAIAKTEAPHKRDIRRDARTVAPELIPTTVDYNCEMQILGSGAKLIQSHPFSGVTSTNRNSYKSEIVLAGEIFRFFFVYDKMGHSAFGSDPMDGEMASIHLYPKKSHEESPNISASISSHGYTELPNSFELRESFRYRNLNYKLRTLCTTVKTFEVASL